MAKNNNNRKRALVVGVAALLVAGVTYGGALVTTNSTIFNNVFQTTATPTNPAELLVEGPSLSGTFTGVVDGELVSEYYNLTNTSVDKDLKFNLGTRIQPGGKKADELAAALTTSIGHAGSTFETGSLKAMTIPAGQQIEVKAGETVLVRVDVFVKDKAAFTALGLGADAKVTVDFQFDSIFLS